VWPGLTYFPDFSRPETRQWWGGHLSRRLDTGVAGIWNDMNEPAVWGGTIPPEVQMEDGGRW
jgi:alpha-glucosidase